MRCTAQYLSRKKGNSLYIQLILQTVHGQCLNKYMEYGLEGHASNTPECITMGREDKGAGSGMKTKRDRNQI